MSERLVCHGRRATNLPTLHTLQWVQIEGWRKLNIALITTWGRISQPPSPLTRIFARKRAQNPLPESHFPEIFLTSSIYLRTRARNSAHCKYASSGHSGALPAFPHPRRAQSWLRRPRFGRNLESVSTSCQPPSHAHHEQQHTRGLHVTSDGELRSFSYQHPAKWTLSGSRSGEVPGSISLAPTLSAHHTG